MKERNNDVEAKQADSKQQEMKRMAPERTSKQGVYRTRSTNGVREARSHMEMIPGRKHTLCFKSEQKHSVCL